MTSDFGVAPFLRHPPARWNSSKPTIALLAFALFTVSTGAKLGEKTETNEESETHNATRALTIEHHRGAEAATHDRGAEAATHDSSREPDSRTAAKTCRGQTTQSFDQENPSSGTLTFVSGNWCFQPAFNC